MTISGDEEELMVVVDRRTNIQRWVACGGVALALWGLLALADDLVAAGVLVSAWLCCCGLHASLHARLPAFRRACALPGRGRSLRRCWLQYAVVGAVNACACPALPPCGWPTAVSPYPSRPHPPHSHTSPRPGLQFALPQVDFLASYGDFDMASPEVQADLYEAAPEAWKRNA